MRPAPPHSPEPLQAPRRRRRLLAAATLLVAVSACGASTAPTPPGPAVLDATTAPSIAATTAPSVAATTAPSIAATTVPSVAATTAPSVAATTASPKHSGASYVACGCGCCGGEPPVSEHCLYHSKGDDLQKIIDQDRASAKRPGCRFAGCSAGVRYSYCD